MLVGRTKQCGIGQAASVCDGIVDSLFAVINADYYGKHGFVAALRLLIAGIIWSSWLSFEEYIVQ